MAISVAVSGATDVAVGSGDCSVTAVSVGCVVDLEIVAVTVRSGVVVCVSLVLDVVGAGLDSGVGVRVGVNVSVSSGAGVGVAV